MSTNQIDLILSKEKKDKTFNKIEYGNAADFFGFCGIFETFIFLH